MARSLRLRRRDARRLLSADIRKQGVYNAEFQRTVAYLRANIHRPSLPVRSAYRRYVCRSVSWCDVLYRLGFEPRVIEHYSLRAGGFMILCPLHDEKSPSMRLWPDGGFYCHGCGHKGDMVRFVALMMRYHTDRDIERFFGSLLPTDPDKPSPREEERE